MFLRVPDVSLGGGMAKLTINQAADRTGLSTSLLYQLCAERRLPHFRLGREGKRGKILIEEADLEAFMATCKVEAGGGAGMGTVPALRHITRK
jgi:excisionase family DNA binding protein